MATMRIIRAFPRRTHATPDDKNAYIGEPPTDVYADVVLVSVTLSYDVDEANRLVEAWRRVCGSVLIGGPALGDPGAEFTPGLFLKKGYVITSRGCPNKCWFCDVPRREGRAVRELPVTDGWNLLDSNILACSREHIGRVFEMLGRQSRRVEFTGGLEAARLRDWHVAALWRLKPKQIFFAYDTPDDLEPLIEAGRMMRYADFTRSHLRCYVLVGYARDTFEAATGRLVAAWAAGFMPMAMLWRGRDGKEPEKVWKRFQRSWARPAATRALMRDMYMRINFP